MSDTNAQQYLFERIRESVSPDQSLVSVIAEALHLSEDSSYRRIRGETPLILEEVKELCRHFRISLDQLLQISNHSTLFETIRIHNKAYTFEAFLTDLVKRLEGVNSLQGKHVYYLTKDIPLFHHFIFKPLFAFRYFFWMKSILQHPEFVNKTFTLDCLPPAVEALGQRIVQLYNQIPSTEIWNTECVNSIILQLEFYREVGFFPSVQDLKTVYRSLLETIRHIDMQAELSKKFAPGENPKHKPENFSFFNNRVTLGDNTILVHTPAGKATYLNFEVLNYMFTYDTAFCDQTYEALQNLMRRSTMISGVSEKQRKIFFNILEHKIQDRINNL
ncbi:MAG TPA: helix-turn-helix domain-containing protein [Chitinophagaceae bacterium]|nr:helix-turn-helix domain-containing protein [Chitinophagaceae bacterium]